MSAAEAVLAGSPAPANRQRIDPRWLSSTLLTLILIGLEVSRCTQCDCSEAAIPRIEALHRLIACALIDKTTRLTGEEVRFLRKLLDWSGSEFAKHMGVAEETVSRWENGRAPMGLQADKLLRMLVAALSGQHSYTIEELRSAGSEKQATPVRMRLRLRGDAWTAMAA